MTESISSITPQQFAQQAAPIELAPTDLVPLPSDGRAYPPGHPLSGKSSIEIRSMTARDEDILTSRALIRGGKVISALIRSCVADKSIDPDSMLAGDRNAVLIGIRITGYGSEYPVKFTCPECNAEVKHTVELGDLPIKRAPKEFWETMISGTNEFPFTLQTSRKLVTFRLLTGVGESELLQIIERSRKLMMQDELVTTRLRLQITSIDGERDPSKLIQLIRSLPARDSRDLRKYIDGVTPRVELKTQAKCTLCSFEGEVEVPIGTEFFWPET
jgi:hypothetical protein